MQLELDPGIARSPAAVEAVTALITTHFDLGGTMMNINILDTETILAADKDPQNFPDLIVRVTGFAAYFALLSPDFRSLVVERIVTG